MTLCRSFLVAALAIGLPASAQTPTPDAGLQFEVAVMKPTADTTQPGLIVHLPGERGYRGVNMPLLEYLTVAYQVRRDQITLPDGFPSGNYDMEGKADRTCTADELHLMLQHLLEERFHLKLHRTTRQVNGYDLVVDKGGPKLADHAGPDTGTVPLFLSPGTQHGTNVSMQYLAFFLSQALGQTVVNKTGLTGHYDFAVDWGVTFMPMPAPQGQVPGSPGVVPNPAALPGAAPDPSAAMMVSESPIAGIFDALRKQLGLRLDKTKVPSQQIIIDHIEKLLEN
jgi:uncharacterized protein (TIGR03435 family)